MCKSHGSSPWLFFCGIWWCGLLFWRGGSGDRGDRIDRGARGTRGTRGTKRAKGAGGGEGLQVLAFGGAAHGVFDEGPEVGVAEGVGEEGAEAARTALGGGYALGQALFFAVGEYLDGVFVFGAVVVEVLVPFQGQDAVLDGDFGEGYHGDGTY